MMALGYPRTIGRYAIRGELGEGGFATVYRAYDPVLDREVALKVLHPHLAREVETRERFIHEGRTLARVHHRHIVQVFDAGAAEGLVYLAMELVEGESLGAIIRDHGPLPADQVARITEQIAAALDALHASGLIHCDIKPANILLDREQDRAVLLDLGVARQLDDTVSGSDLLWGTPSYMAPEQIAAGGSLSPQTDVYQLGATVYALLAGGPPFTGEPVRMMHAVLHEHPPDLAALDRGLPASAAGVVAWAMAKRPDERPDSAGAFAEELRVRLDSDLDRSGTTEQTRRIVLPGPSGHNAGRQEAPGLSPAAGLRPAPAPPTEQITWSEPARTGPLRVSPRRTPLLLGGGLVALLAAAAVLFIVNRGSNDPESLAASLTPGAAAVQSPTQTPAASSAPATATRPAVAPTPQRTATAQPTPMATATASATPSVPAAAEAVAGLLQQAMSRLGYRPSGPVAPVPLDAETVLYVQRGDGDDGQRLFVFLNDTFLGTDWEDASPMGVSNPRGVAAGRFVATYADAGGRPMPIVFEWNGRSLTPNRAAPGHCLPTTGC